MNIQYSDRNRQRLFTPQDPLPPGQEPTRPPATPPEVLPNQQPLQPTPPPGGTPGMRERSHEGKSAPDGVFYSILPPVHPPHAAVGLEAL